MPNGTEKLEEAATSLRSQGSPFPRLAIVLGSGLGGLVDEMAPERRLAYEEIPHFPLLTVPGHAGELVWGKLGTTRLAVMRGRPHYYEGFSPDAVVFPFRALALAGVDTFILTNSSGGMRSDRVPPYLLLIRDHINLMGMHPLIGRDAPSFGPRFPDMSEVYDAKLRAIFRESARAQGISLEEGVYVGVSGPSYETPAEVQMYRVLGGDAVGMSTVPEAIALRHMGKRVVGISCVTNLAAGLSQECLSHADVLEKARAAYREFTSLIRHALPRLQVSS